MSRPRADHSPRLGDAARHLFAVDPTVPADQHGRRYCRCGLLEHTERHHLPPTDPETASAEARRLGEREDNP